MSTTFKIPSFLCIFHFSSFSPMQGLERSQQLVEVCGDYMLRRTSNVLKEYLPQKVQQIIFCKMSPLQLALYKAFLGSESVSAAIEGRKLPKEAALATLPAITALKKLCCHPDLVYNMSADAATGGGGRQQPIITGFEGLQGLFKAQAVYPVYRPFAVQSMHSGEEAEEY
jgi:SNF2 family DNA or RNA helicase